MLQISFGEIASIAGLVVAGFWAVGAALLHSMKAAQDERDKTQDEARREAREALNKQLGDINRALVEQSSGWRDLERELAAHKLEIAQNYLRREDYVRGQTVIEAKLDALYSELKNVQLKGAPHG